MKDIIIVDISVVYLLWRKFNKFDVYLFIMPYISILPFLPIYILKGSINFGKLFHLDIS